MSSLHDWEAFFHLTAGNHWNSLEGQGGLNEELNEAHYLHFQ